MINNKNTISSLLPQNSQNELMKSLETMFRNIERFDIDIIKNCWNPEKCNEELLPYLALQLGVGFWALNLPIAQQRELCRVGILINKHSGTIGALKLALGTLNMGIIVEEWFSYGGTPCTGKALIELGDKEFKSDTFILISNTVAQLKRLAFAVAITTENSFSKILPYVSGAGLCSDTYYIEMEG